jgi:NitT/TauT family transport system permease protein
MSWRWASLPLLLIVWALLAMALRDPIVPTPLAAADRLAREALNGPLFEDLSKTLIRSLAAATVALPTGAALGILLGRVALVDDLFGSWVTVALNLPALVVGVLMYVWLGLTDVALIFAAAITKVPLVAITLREGARGLDRGYDELAKAYRLPFRRRASRIYVPQLLPHALAAARNGLALIWKIVLVFELLGSDGGVGFRIGIFFQHFDVGGILAYTIAFIACVFLIDGLAFRPLEHRILKWRRV